MKFDEWWRAYYGEPDESRPIKEKCHDQALESTARRAWNAAVHEAQRVLAENTKETPAYQLLKELSDG